MNISRPVIRFAVSGVLAALGFVGSVLFAPPKGRSDVPEWQDLICWVSLAFFLIGFVGLIVYFTCWIADGIKAWRRSKRVI